MGLQIVHQPSGVGRLTDSSGPVLLSLRTDSMAVSQDRPTLIG
jgi:hypothetical protein